MKVTFSITAHKYSPTQTYTRNERGRKSSPIRTKKKTVTNAKHVKRKKIQVGIISIFNVLGNQQYSQICTTKGKVVKQPTHNNN